MAGRAAVGRGGALDAVLLAAWQLRAPAPRKRRARSWTWWRPNPAPAASPRRPRREVDAELTPGALKGCADAVVGGTGAAQHAWRPAGSARSGPVLRQRNTRPYAPHCEPDSRSHCFGPGQSSLWAAAGQRYPASTARRRGTRTWSRRRSRRGYGGRRGGAGQGGAGRWREVDLENVASELFPDAVEIVDI